MNMFLGLTIFTIYMAYCLCFVNYDIFPGFETTVKSLHSTTAKHAIKLIADQAKKEKNVKADKIEFSKTYDSVSKEKYNHTNTEEKYIPNIKVKDDNHRYNTTIDNTTRDTLHRKIKVFNNLSGILKLSSDKNETTFLEWTQTTLPPMAPIPSFKFSCVEDEKPINIGAYEVPSHKDLVLLIKKTLIRMFNTYQQKALYFLNDIQEATKATTDFAQKCRSLGTDYLGYKRCVKQVSNRCETITKSLVTSLEKQRSDVSTFIEGTACNVTNLKVDPMVPIKYLAVEEVSLEFALPSFLRLLGGCSVYCHRKIHKSKKQRPVPRITDQELVVRHYLAKKTNKVSKWSHIKEFN